MMPMLKLMVSRIYYTGQLGNASSVKAIHQIVGATNLVASLEYMYIGSKYGLGPKVGTHGTAFTHLPNAL